MKTLKQIISATLLLVVMAGCQKESQLDEMRRAANSAISVAMTDTSRVVSIYDAINIEIVSVEVRYANASRGKEWVKLVSRPGLYDLKELNSNLHKEIAAKRDLVKGPITDLRLTIGTNNTVVVAGSTFKLHLSTAGGSVITLGLQDAIINPNTTTEILLQVDVARTVIKAGSMYVFEPAIRVHSITQRAN